jgi:hypothetical protein
MTIAVCFNCGALKFGSFNQCGECGRTPTTDVDAAWSLVCSDHHFTAETLKQISLDMQARGVRPKLDPETLKKVLPEVRSALAMLYEIPQALNSIRRSATIPTKTSSSPAGRVQETAKAASDRHRQRIIEILTGQAEAKGTPAPGTSSLRTTPGQIVRFGIGSLGIFVFGALVVASILAWFTRRSGPAGTVLDGLGRQVYEAPFWLRLVAVNEWRGPVWWVLDAAVFWIMFGIGFVLVSFGFGPRGATKEEDRSSGRAD